MLQIEWRVQEAIAIAVNLCALGGSFVLLSGLDSGPQYDIICQGTRNKSEKVHFVAGVMIFSFHLQTIYIDDFVYLHD